MKLLRCNDCGSIFNLTGKVKTCVCGKTKGRYINDIDAEYSGNGTPIGIGTNSFSSALKTQLIIDNTPGMECNEGVRFVAFVIPKQSESIKKVKQL